MRFLPRVASLCSRAAKGGWVMRSRFRFVVVAIAVVLAFGISRSAIAADSTSSNMGKTTASPANGWTLHIDAKRHVPGNPDYVIHHWCRPAEGGITECQLYDSDAANAQLVGVEVVVPTATWKTFSASEQALWHYHKIEIPKVSATLPGMSAAQAAKVLASLTETYGKVYLLWDPSKSKVPTGQPFVYVLK
jgi:hypothetical protein